MYQPWLVMGGCGLLSGGLCLVVRGCGWLSGVTAGCQDRPLLVYSTATLSVLLYLHNNYNIDVHVHAPLLPSHAHPQCL